MSIRFEPLMTIGTSHAYYADGGRDFGFVLPGRTQAAMRAGRMLAREADGMLHVLYEAGDSKVPLADISGQTLYFGLRLDNPYFDNFSNPALAGVGLTPLYANGAAPGVLDPARGVRLVAGLYAHQPQAAARPVKLALADVDGHVVDSQLLAADGPAVFDLRTLPPGEWNVAEDYGGAAPPASATLLLFPELRDAGVWGAVAVTVAAGFYAAPPALAIHFTPRQEALKYYIVAANYSASDFDQLQVVDGGFADEARPEIKFDKIAPGAFTADDYAPSLLADAGQRIVLFKSKAPVARRERGLRKIQLQRNGEVVIAHLPQPRSDQAGSKLIINLSKP